MACGTSGGSRNSPVYLIWLFTNSRRIHWFFVGFRVNDYINSVLSHNLVDPDGVINLRKKRLELGLEQDISPSTDVTFPRDGFEVGISSVPKVGFGQIWKYLMEEVEFKKQLSVQKRIAKGYNFFQSGKVLGLYSKTENGLFYVKSQVFIFKDWADVYCKSHNTCQLWNWESILPMSSWEWWML